MLWQSFFTWLRWKLQVWHAYEQGFMSGQGLVEYALILIFVAVVMVVVVTILGPGIANVYSNIVAILKEQ